MQVHTIKIIFPLGEHDIIYLKKKHLIEISKVNDFQSEYNFATFSIYRQPIGRYYLSIVIDCILLLDKIHMLNSDYFIIERRVKDILLRMFGHENHFKHHVLKRIDYKFDAYIPNKEERKLLLFLYKKLTRSFRYQKMRDGIIKDNKELRIYDKGEGTNDREYEEENDTAEGDEDEEDEDFETTIYHSSKSVSVVMYDKEEERRAKKKTPKEYEEDIIRYEIAVMHKHINYRRNTKECPDPLDAKLDNYFQSRMWKEYFSHYLNPIYLDGDFYKLSEAKKIINDSSEKPAAKRKLLDFLSMISRGNIDTPSKKGMNPKTIKSREYKLEKLNINPILIPQNYKGAPMRLENPLRIFYKETPSCNP